MTPDDERLGRLFKTLRRESRLSQNQVAIATKIPVRDIRRLESGNVGEVAYGRVRRLFAELDARARLSLWWHGAAADRLLDKEHASLGERAATLMTRYGWQTPMELSFSEYGERGSIDIFGHRREYMAVTVCEVKSAFGSLEELNRTLDAKVRLAPKLCRDRFGWTPKYVARLLILPEASTARRVVSLHSQTMNTLYPARGREIHRWLRHPDRPVAGIWFLSEARIRKTVSPESA